MIYFIYQFGGVTMLKLREFRESKGLSQRDIAKIMGISQAQYWHLETGKSLLNTKQIMELCKIFKCSPNELLDFKDHYQIIMSEVFDEEK